MSKILAHYPSFRQQSRSDFDDYKQIYHLTFTQSKIVYRTNPDYDRSMLEHGESVGQRLSRDVPWVAYLPRCSCCDWS